VSGYLACGTVHETYLWQKKLELYHKYGVKREEYSPRWATRDLPGAMCQKRDQYTWCCKTSYTTMAPPLAEALISRLTQTFLPGISSCRYRATWSLPAHIFINCVDSDNKAAAQAVHFQLVITTTELYHSTSEKGISQVITRNQYNASSSTKSAWTCKHRTGVQRKQFHRVEASTLSTKFRQPA